MHRVILALTLLAAVWHPTTAALPNQYLGPNLVKAISSFGAFDSGDLNRNGTTQLVVYDPNNNVDGITIYNTPMNTTSPTVAATIPNTFASGNSPLSFPSVRVVDINQDGYEDLVFNIGNEGITYVLNQAVPTSYSYSTLTQITIAGGAISNAQLNFVTQLLTGDINGDKYPDIVFISTGIGNVGTLVSGILLNPSSSNGSVSSPWTYVPIEVDSAYVPDNFASATLIDLTGDGLLDLVVVAAADYNEGIYYLGPLTTLVYLNIGGSFGSSTAVYESTPSHFGISTTLAWFGLNAVGDINGDGLMDIVTGDNGNKGIGVPIVILLQNNVTGSVTFTAMNFTFSFSDPTYSASTQKTGPLGVAIHDLNNDGMVDLVFHFSKYMFYALQTQQNPPVFATPLSFTPGTFAASSTQNILNFMMMDVNNDGFEDVVFVTNANVYTFINNEPELALPSNAPVALSYLYTGGLYSPSPAVSGTNSNLLKDCVALAESTGEPFGGYSVVASGNTYCCLKRGTDTSANCTIYQYCSTTSTTNIPYTTAITFEGSCYAECYAAGNQYVPPPTLTKPYRVFQGARYTPTTNLELLSGNVIPYKYSIIASTEQAPAITRKRSNLNTPAENIYSGGYLVKYGEGKISNEYACVWAGALSGTIPDLTCTIGAAPCDGTVDNFFYDLSSNQCYARCYTH